MEFKTSLITAFEEILDKMAFMFFEETSPGQIGEPKFDFASRIDFKGKLAGTLDVFFTDKTARALARNLIGIRPNDVLHQGTLEDALREFGNILMGRTLSLLDPDHPFELQLPVAGTAAEAGSDPANGSPASLVVEGMLDEVEPCRIVVHLKN
jgi:CheY-specific phosphatase CheX